MLNLVFIILIAYLLGSIPTAIIVSKYFYKKDVRQHGSKNAGATNVFRVLGWKPGLGVLLFDMLKGVAATVWVYQLLVINVDISPVYLQMITGISAVLGHIWTVFAGFKGGKGVAAGAGMLIGLAPKEVVLCLIVFFAIVAVTRMVSAGSILAAATFPVTVFSEKYIFSVEVPTGILLFSLAVALLIIYTHRSNVSRIFNGSENKISFSKKES